MESVEITRFKGRIKCIFSKSVKDIQTNASSITGQKALGKNIVLAADEIYTV